MQCKSCGSVNDAEDNICKNCGAFLNLDLEVESTISLSPIEVDEEFSDINIVPEEKPVLVVKKGPHVGHKFNLSKEEITLGRDPGCDIFLDDITVSRRHAKITLIENQVSVTDAESLNGTYVNQERIEGPTTLQSDDELQVGKFKLLFLDKS